MIFEIAVCHLDLEVIQETNPYIGLVIAAPERHWHYIEYNSIEEALENLDLRKISIAEIIFGRGSDSYDFYIPRSREAAFGKELVSIRNYKKGIVIAFWIRESLNNPLNAETIRGKYDREYLEINLRDLAEQFLTATR